MRACSNIRLAFDALRTLGYQPRVPITAEQLADDQLRERLIRDKGMQVLQVWSDQHRETPIGVFVREPFPFDVEFDRATVKQLRGAGPVRVVSIPSLIAMKEEAGRPEDRIDVEHLRTLLEEP